MQTKTYFKTKTLVIASLLAALVCIATMLIKIPSPLKGYLNLGDGVVLLCGFMLSPVYGFLAAGIGSALADLLLGYATYAPATFLIKGGMALILYFLFRLLQKKIGKIPALLIGGILAEIFMVAGYFVFEGFLYGFLPSLVNIPANAVQGAAGIVIGTLLSKLSEKLHLTER